MAGSTWRKVSVAQARPASTPLSRATIDATMRATAAPARR
jgi:hypothetical protein